MARQVELEVINYKIDDMQRATVEIVTLFARHSGIDGTNRWMSSLLNIQERFAQRNPTDWSLSARGLDLTFSGFPNPIPTIEDDKVVLKAREPRFILEPVHQDLRPRERTLVEKVTEEIAMEMHAVYHLQVDNYPTTLTFPKGIYAEVERVSAVMI